MYGSLSSRVIMPFPLIYRMLIYMFPLLSIIIISYILFGIMCPYQWKVLPFKVCILLSIWMTFWSSFALSGWVRGHACFCVPCWSVLVYISIFPGQTFASLSPLLSWGLCWDTVYMLVSLPPDKLADTQQLALALLWDSTCYSP